MAHRIDVTRLGAIDLDSLNTAAESWSVGSWRDDAEEDYRSERVQVSPSLWLHPAGVRIFARPLAEEVASESWV